MFAIALAQVQDISLNLLVPMAPPVKPVKVHLDDISSLQCVDHTTQVSVISKPAKSALNPSVHVTNKNDN